MSKLVLNEISTPSTPSSNKVAVYCKEKSGVSTLYYKGDDGVEHRIGGGLNGIYQSGQGAVITVDGQPVQIKVTGAKKVALAVTGSVMFGSGSSALSGHLPSMPGLDTFFFVSGSVGGKNNKGYANQGVATFGGDVVISGTLYAENMTVEVKETTTGSFEVEGTLAVSSSAVIDGGLTVNASKDTTSDQRLLVLSDLGQLLSTRFNQGSTGAHVSVNWAGVANHDFAVTSSNKEPMFLVDGGKDSVIIGGPGTSIGVGGASGADTNFFISGSMGSKGSSTRGTTATSGDLVVSGNIHAGQYIIHEGDDDTFIRFLPDRLVFKAGSVEMLTLTEDDSQDVVVVNEASADVDFRVETNLDANAFKVDSGNNEVVINDDGTGATDFRVETDGLTHAIFVDASTDAVVLGRLGKGGADTFLFVSGSTGSKGSTTVSGSAVFGGDVVVSGNIHTSEFIYHEADTDTFIKFTDDKQVFKAGNVEMLTLTEDDSQDIVVVNEGGADVNFRVETSGAPAAFVIDAGNNEVVVNEGGGSEADFRAETNHKTHALFIDAGTNQVLIHSGGAILSNNEAAAGDINFYVSGTVGGQIARVNRSTSLFGGDLFVSGNIFSKADLRAIGNNGGAISGSITRTKTGLSYLQAGANVTITSQSNGQIVIRADNDGAGLGAALVGWNPTGGSGQAGEIATTGSLSVSGSNVGIGRYLRHVGDEDTHIQFTTDKQTFTCGAIEMLTLVELPSSQDEVIINEGSNDVDFRVESSNISKILMVDAANDRVHFNYDGGAAEFKGSSVNGELFTFTAAGCVFNNVGHGTHDFTVETDNGATAFFVDAGSDVVSINPGTDNVRTIISNTAGEALSVTPAAVVVNEGSHALIDFRVESDGEAAALLIDSSANYLTINSGSSAFNTRINTANGDSFKVTGGGVVVNDAGHSNNDFRVETNNSTHAIFVDSSNDYIIINDDAQALDFAVESENKPGMIWVDGNLDTISLGLGLRNINQYPGTDTHVFVSGTAGGKDTAGGNVVTFAGDVMVSGTMHLRGAVDNPSLEDPKGNNVGLVMSNGIAWDDGDAWIYESGDDLYLKSKDDIYLIPGENGGGNGNAYVYAYTGSCWMSGSEDMILASGDDILITAGGQGSYGGLRIKGDGVANTGYPDYGDGVWFHVSGAIGSGGRPALDPHRGITCFGGDVVHSGSVFNKAYVALHDGTGIVGGSSNSDPSTLPSHAHIYSKEVSTKAEIFVRDENGNVTKISPHNSEGDWEYFSENNITGKKVKVNMEKMIRRLEEITGETFFEEYIIPDE